MAEKRSVTSWDYANPGAPCPIVSRLVMHGTTVSGMHDTTDCDGRLITLKCLCLCSNFQIFFPIRTLYTLFIGNPGPYSRTMYGFRHVSRRRSAVPQLLRTDYDSQSKLKHASTFKWIYRRVGMKLLILLTLGLALFIFAWPAQAFRAAPKRLHLGVRRDRKFSIKGDRFYLNGESTRLISCECASKPELNTLCYAPVQRLPMSRDVGMLRER